jgi:hypothetical protein
MNALDSRLRGNDGVFAVPREDGKDAKTFLLEGLHRSEDESGSKLPHSKTYASRD